MIVWGTHTENNIQKESTFHLAMIYDMRSSYFRQYLAAQMDIHVDVMLLKRGESLAVCGHRSHPLWKVLYYTARSRSHVDLLVRAAIWDSGVLAGRTMTLADFAVFVEMQPWRELTRVELAGTIGRVWKPPYEGSYVLKVFERCHEHMDFWRCSLDMCRCPLVKLSCECRAVRYCNVEHQRQHWRVHKDTRPAIRL